MFIWRAVVTVDGHAGVSVDGHTVMTFKGHTMETIDVYAVTTVYGYAVKSVGGHAFIPVDLRVASLSRESVGGKKTKDSATARPEK